MKAVTLKGGLAVGDVPDPVPAPGEALIEVTLAGICGTDLELAKGYMDFDGIPGHEFVGVVEVVAGAAEERGRWGGRRGCGGGKPGGGASGWGAKGTRRP